MKLFETITPLLRRVIVFACAFIVVSGLIGPAVVSSELLSRDGFWIYGGIGKGLLFGLVAFVLLARRKPTPAKIEDWRPVYLWWVAAAIVALLTSWMSIRALLDDQTGLFILAGAHGGIVIGIACLAIAIFGPSTIGGLWRNYQKEIRIAAIFALLFYAFLHAVYALWQPLASVVMVAVSFLLGVSGLHSEVLPPNTLIFDKFGITIAESCSGVESIALFTSLYAIIGLLDWKRLRKRRYFAVFPVALIVLFVFNILRVYGLIMAGYYISADIAFSLFHTYAGMVFFILYSALFWILVYKHLLKSHNENTTGH